MKGCQREKENIWKCDCLYRADKREIGCTTRILKTGELLELKPCKGCLIENIVPSSELFTPKGKGVVVVNYSMNPEVPGHLVAQPRRHVNKLSELSKEEAKELMEKIRRYAKATEDVIGKRKELGHVEKIYVYCLSETEDFHLHFHIKPRFAGIPEEKRGAKYIEYKNDPEKNEKYRKILPKLIRDAEKMLRKNDC